MKDLLGDKIKHYEALATPKRFLPLLPILVRLDGRTFTRFTKGLKRPFDENFHHCMENTMLSLVNQTGALVGYTQSDEITLLFYSHDLKSQLFFDGKIQKIISITAAMATSFFTDWVQALLPSKAGERPLFDSRAFTVPTKKEALDVFIWREADAVRNSIESAARSVFSHHQCHYKSCDELQEMLFQAGINWNDYPSWAKRGSYAHRKRVSRKFTPEEISVLPEKHQARSNPDLEVLRSETARLDLPPITQVANCIEVFFDGATPHMFEERKRA